VTRNEIAQDFLTRLFGPIPLDSCLEIRRKKNATKGTVQTFHPKVSDVQVDRYDLDEHVWFGVALRKLGLGGRREDLTWVNCVWADIDTYKSTESQEQVLQRLARFEVPPTAVVDSGGGLHVYWRLNRSLDMQNQTQATFIREVVFGLSKRVGGDRSVHDPTRVLRVPATFNVGDGVRKVYTPAREVTVLQSDWSRIYVVEDLSRYREPVEARAPLVPIPVVTSDGFVPILHVSPRMTELIVKGWQAGCGYTSRSELDQAAMIAMVRAGHTDADIVKTWKDTSLMIGEKYREKGADGDRYLSQTLANAKQWVATHAPQADQHETTVRGHGSIRELAGRLEARRETGWVPIFNRPIKALAKLIGEEHGFRVEIATPTGPEQRTLRADDLATSSGFKRALSLAGAWTGTDRDIQLLIPYLEEQNPPVRRSVRTVGWFEGTDRVIFPNAHLVADGTLQSDTDFLYLGKMVDARLEDHDDWATQAAAILPHLFDLHREESVVPVIGWFMATFAAPMIRKQSSDGAFPLLMMFGTPEAGKTTTLEILQRMCGRTGPLYSLQETTRFASVELVSSSNTLPIIFDEHRRSDVRTYRQHIYPIFRSAYQSGIATRGRADLSIARYHLQAPVVVAGETPFRDPALIDRSIHVRFERGGKNEAALRHLIDLPLDRFNAGMYRHVRTKDMKALWSRAAASLPPQILHNTMQIRQRHAWTVVSAGLSLLVPLIPQATIDRYISLLYKYQQDPAGDVAVSTSAVVEEAVRALAELVRARRIRDGFEFVIRQTPDGDSLLWIVPSLVMPAIEEYFMKYPTDLPMSREAISTRMRENATTVNPVVVKFADSVRIKNKVGKGHAISLTRVEQEMGIPIDYWLQSAIQENETP